MAKLVAPCAGLVLILVVEDCASVDPAATSTPAADEAAPATASETYEFCEAAGLERIQGNQGPDRRFLTVMVPSARDGDKDGAVCGR